MRKVLAGYKNGVDVNNDKRFITKWMKTWIAAKGGKVIFYFKSTKLQFSLHGWFREGSLNKMGLQVYKNDVLIPCNGESPLTSGTCFDYNACILHLQKVKQQNI